MTILFMGGEIGAFTPSDSSVIEDITATRFNSGFARCGIAATGSAYAQTADFAATANDLWVHFEVKRGTGSANNAARILELVDNADVPVFKVETDANQSTAQMYYWDGAAYQTIGSAVTVNTNDTLQTFDVHVVGNSGTGTATLYVAGTERATGTADLTAVNDMEKARFYGRIGGVGPMVYSQVIAATGESTIGMRLVTMYASGTGATDQWTGSYTSIDETVYSDADFIFSDAADQVEMFAGTLVGAISGYTVRAVGVSARGSTDGTGPTNLQLAVRTAATNYFSGSNALGAGYGAFVGIWATNPNTTLAWSSADASAIQFGVKSIA